MCSQAATGLLATTTATAAATTAIGLLACAAATAIGSSWHMAITTPTAVTAPTTAAAPLLLLLLTTTATATTPLHLLAEEGGEGGEVERSRSGGLASASSTRPAQLGASTATSGAGGGRRSPLTSGRGGKHRDLPPQASGVDTLLEAAHGSRHAGLTIIDLLEQSHVSTDARGDGSKYGQPLQQVLHQGVTLLELVHSLLRQSGRRGWEGHTRRHHRGDGSGRGAQRLTQVDLRTQGGHQCPQLPRISLEAFGLKGVSEGAVHGVAHAPGVIVRGDAGVRRSHRERVPTRQGGRRHGGGEG